MAIYTVYRRPGDAPDRAVFVKEGFSFPALIFTFFWAARHRMWLVAAMVFAIFALLQAGQSGGFLSPIVALVSNVALGLLMGLEAAPLRERSLRLAGYRECGLVQGSSIGEAELKYFMDRRPDALAAPPASALRMPAAGQGDPLGLFGNV